ncbi:Sec-independent protein translocase protein TatB [Thiorhodospira sibirica]|uniref:Sec-independent protein translocase protein TatB n=1 Tax=Thiorhodospira sibirica TaxID=154347 RepID=UPI00022C33BA|nr:Sec-independent protein translocase protein TatB [Thiorhodospira sibirica]
MFDIGFWEITIIAVLALLIVGPERLPGLAREAGRWVANIRRFVSSARSDIERELQTEELKRLLQQQDQEIRELKQMFRDTEQTLREEVDQTTQLMHSDASHDKSSKAAESQAGSAPEISSSKAAQPPAASRLPDSPP